MIGWLLMAVAASAEPSADICAQADACRHVDSVRIESPDGKETVITVDQELPWVVQDNLLLVPGDWIIIRLVDRDGTLVPELVEAGNAGNAPEPSEGEIRFKVHPFDEGNLILEVLSRRPEILEYAALVVVGEDNPQRTSVCSLHPGTTMFESWMWPIRQIALWGFRQTEDMGCKQIEFDSDSGEK